MRPSLLGLLVLAVIVSLPGCSLKPPSTALVVQITNVFPNNTVQAGGPPVTLNAKVFYDGPARGVKWILTAANTNCSPACGTLVASASPSFNAVYTPPAQAPMNQQATITAVAVDQPSQSYSFLFTIIPTTSVTITNKFSSVIAGGVPITVNATVANDPSDMGVSWTLAAGGSSCSPACGTLVPATAPSFSAVYTPPSSVPTGSAANPVITAASVSNTSASDNFSFAIESTSALLSGSYVFLLRGYDTFSGQPMAMAGAITADGKGNITSGEIDFNNGGGINFVPSPATGTYTVDPSFNGITQVAVEISSFTFPGSNIDLKYRFVLSGDGTHGRIIEFDGSGYLNAGSIQKQDSSAISAAPSGNFAFGLDSDAPLAGRIVAGGQLIFGSSGITGGLIDMSKAGNTNPIYAAATISAGSVAAPDANGRGTFGITVQGDTSQYAYYIVDADHIKLIQIDPGLTFGTVQAGAAIHQNNLTADSINTSASVLQLTGMDEPSGTNTPGPDVIIGVMTISGGNAFTMTFDSNDIGAVVTSHPASGSITSFDPTTGRAVLSYPGGFESGFVDAGVFYMYDQGAGFFIDTDITTNGVNPPITNNAFSGTLVPQTGGPFGSSSLSGNLLAGFGGSASSNVPNWDLAIALSPANGTYAALGNLTSLPSQDGLASGAQFSGTYRFANTTLGRGTVTLPAAVFGDFVSGSTVNASFYIVAPNQFVLIGVQSGLYSGVAFFDPQ